ncbi:MAG: methyltransferase domain-containing protein [Gammaproteobacteria bacterium]
MTDQFAEKSKDWDERPVPVQISRAVGRLLQRLPWDTSMRVMDFGAGTGLIAASVAPRVARIVAVDTSPSMLQALAAKPELQGKVETRCHDILESPLDERFDAIISAMALHHVEDTQAAASRFAEHLKPGGRLALAEHHVEDTQAAASRFAEHLKPGGRLALADLDSEDGSFHPPDTEGVFHHGFDRVALQSTLQAAGFEDVRFVTALEVEKEGSGPFTVFFVTARRVSF